MKSKKRREIGEYRLAELRRLASDAGFELQEYSRVHCRLFGAAVVDYWPTTGKAWLTGSSAKATRMTPTEVVSVAREARS